MVPNTYILWILYCLLDGYTIDTIDSLKIICTLLPYSFTEHPYDYVVPESATEYPRTLR